MPSIHRFLDEHVPLRGASFKDVVALEVDIPTRYAECFALLVDGRRVPFCDRRQFLGHSGFERRRRLYFSGGSGEIVCVRTNSARKRQIRGLAHWRRVVVCRAYSSSDERVRELGKDVHRIIAIDGSLLFASPDPAARGSLLQSLGDRAGLFGLPPIEAVGKPA